MGTFKMIAKSNLQLATNTVLDTIINSTWKPTLVVTGLEGLPSIENAGNVIHPMIKVKLSMRLPPTLDPNFASDKVIEIL